MDLKYLDELASKIKSMRPLNPAELGRLHEDFLIENTYNSNAIEGNTLTLRETALVLQDGITIAEKPLKDHLEAIGHRDAFEYIVSLVDASAHLTESVIKNIHALVLMNDAQNRGVYRRVPVKILGAIHTPPPPYLVQESMEQLIADYCALKQNKHIIEAIAEFHLRFEGIHPFVDGNGRTGRLILNFELMKSGLLPVNIKFTDRRKYYDSFDAYYGGDRSAEALTELIARYETEELENRIEVLSYK